VKPARPAAKPPVSVSVGELLRQRLRETNRSAEELAEAAHVPAGYIEELITGRRRPPLPARTDVYERMTQFLRLGRNDLAACASAERAGSASTPAAGPSASIRRSLLALCEPETAGSLERRARQHDGELAELIQRLLNVAQASVRRVLDDQIGLRVAATQSGTTYLAMRVRVLDFLDATPDTLTADDLTSFVRPRIAMWDVDLQTGVLRVVLRTPDMNGSHRRRPVIRGVRLSRGK